LISRQGSGCGAAYDGPRLRFAYRRLMDWVVSRMQPWGRSNMFHPLLTELQTKPRALYVFKFPKIQLVHDRLDLVDWRPRFCPSP